MKYITGLVAAGLLMTASACAATVSTVSTPKGTYRFARVPFDNNTKAELCETKNGVKCKAVNIKWN